jgi:hypothetical protein
VQDFEVKENVLLAKRETKSDDKQEILDKVQECADRLDRRKGELEGVVAKKAAVISQFTALVPEGDPYREPLAKIFHRYCSSMSCPFSLSHQMINHALHFAQQGAPGNTGCVRTSHSPL